ncbi:anti-sigma F factor [Clostridia bacterium]|nr:anti-sigma F factor [Clostridia bacterium]
MNVWENEIKIEFDALSENEQFARTTAAAYASKFDPTVSELTELKTAVSEAVTNSVIHSKTDKITMTLKRLKNTLRVEIKDYGIGIPDIGQAMEPLFTTAENDERSGLGFTVMQQFTDTLEVTSAKDGTTIIMTKKIGEE